MNLKIMILKELIKIFTNKLNQLINMDNFINLKNKMDSRIKNYKNDFFVNNFL